MVKLALVIIFTTLTAGVAANAQNDGGLVAPELTGLRQGIFSIRII